MSEEKREAAVEALDKFWSDKTGEWLGTNTLRKMVDVVAAALTKQEAGEVSRSQTAQALEIAEQIAWDEADKELARYDAGETTYGHHAAEFIAKEIRALSLPAPDAGWRTAPPDYELGKWHGLKEAAKIADDMAANRRRVESRQGAYAASFIAERIRALIPAPPVGDGK